MKHRSKPKMRKKAILSAAIKVATMPGNSYRQITQQDISDKADVSRGLITHYFKDMRGLRMAIMQEAVKTRNYALLAQGIVANDRTALNAPQKDRETAIALLRTS